MNLKPNNTSVLNILFCPVKSEQKQHQYRPIMLRKKMRNKKHINNQDEYLTELYIDDIKDGGKITFNGKRNEKRQKQ